MKTKTDYTGSLSDFARTVALSRHGLASKIPAFPGKILFLDVIRNPLDQPPRQLQVVLRGS
jgi:hypothetical protein